MGGADTGGRMPASVDGTLLVRILLLREDLAHRVENPLEACHPKTDQAYREIVSRDVHQGRVYSVPLLKARKAAAVNAKLGRAPRCDCVQPGSLPASKRRCAMEQSAPFSS